MHARAPLRIGLGGGGTDLFPFRRTFGGCTLSVTVRKYATATLGGKNNISPLVSAIKDKFDFKENIEISVEAPPYSGLGASAAIAVATIGLIAKGRLPRESIADLAFKIEREELKISGGAQDQYASSIGGFNYYEYNTDSVIVLPMIRSSFLDELERRLVLVFVKKREMSGSGGAIQEDISRCSIKETCNEMRHAIRQEDMKLFGELLDFSWQEKKKLSPFIADDFILNVEYEVKKAGALGFKLSGAGGGGYALILCEDLNSVREKIVELGLLPEKVEFDWDGLVVA